MSLSHNPNTYYDHEVEIPCCDRCGHEGGDLVKRPFGKDDYELVCQSCLDDAAEQAEMDREDDEAYEDGDFAFRSQYEEDAA